VVDQAPNKHKAPDANSSLSLSHHSPKVTFASGGFMLTRLLRTAMTLLVTDGPRISRSTFTASAHPVGEGADTSCPG